MLRDLLKNKNFMGLENISTDQKEWEVDDGPIDPRIEQELQKFWERGRDTFLVNGKTVEFYGLGHTIDTLRIYRKEIEMAIEQASCVFSEGAPTLYSENSPLQEYLLPVDKKDIRDMTYFMNEIHKICQNKSRRVYTSDPIMSGRLADIAEKAQFWREDEVKEQTNRLQLILASITGILVGTSIEDQENEKMGQPALETRRGTTRRDFLKGILSGVTLLATNNSLGKILSLEREEGFDRLDYLGFNVRSLRDYRDVCIAKGLDLLTKNIQSDDPIVAIYGAGHTAPVKFYLENPREREWRFQMYEFMRKKIPTALLGYEVDKDGNWEITEESKYEKNAPSLMLNKK